MGKDARGATKAERAWLRREAERRARKAKDESDRIEHRKIDPIGGEGWRGRLRSLAHGSIPVGNSANH